MSGRPTSLTRRFLPSVVGGLVLLLAGILLLLFGGWLSAGSPAEFEFWLVLVGVIVLGAAMFAMLLGDTPAASTVMAAPAASEPTPVEALPAVEGPESSDTPSAVAEVAEVLPPGPPEPEPTPLSRPITTSIPGAYLASLGTAPPPELVPWDGPAPPIAAALPFVAMPRGAEGWSGPAEGASDAESAMLEVELARLRARVRELESAPSPAPVAPPASFAPSRSGASRSVPSLISAAEPPRPALSVTGATRACVGCGTFVPTKGPDLRCGSCGRLLCTTCYWRYGSGAGLQRCPECRRSFEESGRTAISGGRAGPSIISTSSSPSGLFR